MEEKYIFIYCYITHKNCNVISENTWWLTGWEALYIHVYENGKIILTRICFVYWLLLCLATVIINYEKRKSDMLLQYSILIYCNLIACGIRCLQFIYIMVHKCVAFNERNPLNVGDYALSKWITLPTGKDNLSGDKIKSKENTVFHKQELLYSRIPKS